MLIALIGPVDSMHLCRNIPVLWHSVNTWDTTCVWNKGKSREERSPALSISVSICISEKSGPAPSPTPPLSELLWIWFFPFTIDSVSVGYC